MIRIAIVEDDRQVQAQLADYIRRYERQFGRMFELSLFEDGDEIVSDYRAVYDIILLDVQMRRMDGMAAAERIRQMDKDVLLIFITNMAQFAIRGYAVDALDYVLKPVPYFAFSQQLQKAVARLQARQKTFLTVPVEGGLRRVNVATLYYLESDGHKVRLYGEDGELTAPGTLKSFEEKLAGKPFARCNSGYLVNLAQVLGGAAEHGAGRALRTADQPPQEEGLHGSTYRLYRGRRPMTLPDIPRLYTALAEWLACLLYLLALRPRFGRVGTVLLGAGWLVGMGAFLQLTGHVPLVWWIPCMMAAVAAMYLFLLLGCELSAQDAGYCCARAFILAEFAASLEWQLHCLLWPDLPGGHPLSLLLMVAVYAVVYGFVFWFDVRRIGRHVGAIGASWRSLASAVVMALTAFAVSNLSFAQAGSNTMSVFYIRTLVDFAGVLILSSQQEQLREARLHEELSAMDNVLHRQYEQYHQSKENIHLLNRRYHDLKVQIAAIRAERDPGKQAAALDEMESGIRMYEAQNKTGNPVLDTLLTAKSLYCQQHEINLTCVADGHLLDFMPTADICTIVGTALDNATESVEAIPDTELHDFYASYTSSRPKMSESKQAWTLPEPTADMYTDEMMNNAKNFSDVAVIVIARIGGEGYNDMPKDLSTVAYDSNSTEYDDFPEGHHYLELSQTERNMVDLVCSNFDNVLLVYNSAHSFELGFVDEYPQIKSVLWCPGTGNVGFNSLGKILNGEINPSGRTSDTFVYDLTNTPWWNNSNQLPYENISDMAVTSYRTDGSEVVAAPKFTNYVEGIYVGYKWYETAAAEGFLDYDKVVQYPFGYGLSYTTFDQKMSDMTVADGNISFTVTVTNTGSAAGKDVVEVYSNPPYTNGGIEKSAANLITFEKTALLQPGESEEVAISFPVDDLASYDMNVHRSYVLEAGDYIISINKDSHNVIDSRTYTVDSDVVYDTQPRSTDNIVATNQFDFAAGDVTYLSRKDGFANYAQATAAPASLDMAPEYVEGFYTNEVFDFNMYIDDSVEMPTTGADNGLKLADMRGKDYDDPMWEDLLDEMTVEEMSNLCGLAGFQTAEVPSIGKVATVDCDGPASINNNFTGTGSIGFPVAVMIACTWNQDLAYQFGENIGKMANEMNVNGWYAPAMNTHRTPFGGRNFEYYSEDGVLAGKIAANAVAGAKSRGVYAYIKHFAMYDSNAMMVSIWSNEQAMREIYFKPFEYAVKEGGANAVMCAWCDIGNRWAGACSELLETVLRDEWGFRGFVLTDNFTPNGRGYMNADLAFHNGVDALLTTYDSDYNHMKDLTAASNVATLRKTSKNILYTVVNSSAYAEDAANAGMEGWKVTAIAIDVVAVLVLAALDLTVIRKQYKKRKQATAPQKEQ